MCVTHYDTFSLWPKDVVGPAGGWRVWFAVMLFIQARIKKIVGHLSLLQGFASKSRPDPPL